MRPDLFDAEAAIKWALGQLPVLEGRLKNWRANAPFSVIADTETIPGKKLYRFSAIKPLDPIISAEAGSIINSIRTSLDLLAAALAERNGRKPGRSSFPFWNSEEEFLAPTGRTADGKPSNPILEKIARLSPVCQDAIKALKPFPGPNGNPMLCALHDLDVTRKHKRLLNTFVFPRGISFDGFPGGAIRLDGPARWEGFNEETVLAWTDADVPDGKIYVGLHIAFDEEGHIHGKNFTASIQDFARMSYDILAKFCHTGV